MLYSNAQKAKQQNNVVELQHFKRKLSTKISITVIFTNINT